MTTGEHPPVRVLFFAGSGRSGTTVVSNILGQLPGAFAAGELRYLWQRGVEQDHLCGCGEPFSSCPVWTAVMARVRSGDRRDEPAIGRRLLGRLRMARLPGILLRDALGRPAIPAHPDDAAVTDLYRAIADETGADLVIDGSKLPPYGLLLRQQPGIELYVLHLVRDPRATAFSWLRSKPTRDTAAGAQMQRQETWKSSLLWTVWNLTVLRLWKDGDPACAACATRTSSPTPWGSWDESPRWSAPTRRTCRSSPPTASSSPRPTRSPATPTGTTPVR